MLLSSSCSFIISGFSFLLQPFPYCHTFREPATASIPSTMHPKIILSSLLAGQAAATILPRSVVTVYKTHTNTVIVTYTGEPAAPAPHASAPAVNKNPIGAIIGALKGVPKKTPVRATAHPNPSKVLNHLNPLKGAPTVRPNPTKKLGGLNPLHGAPRYTPPPPPPATTPLPPAPSAAPPKTFNYGQGLSYVDDGPSKRSVMPEHEVPCMDVTTITSLSTSTAPATTKLKMYGDNPYISDSSIATRVSTTTEPITSTHKLYSHNPIITGSSIATKITSAPFHNITLPIVTETPLVDPPYTSRKPGTLPVITATPTKTVPGTKTTSTVMKTVTVPKLHTTIPSTTQTTSESSSSIDVTSVSTIPTSFTNPWDALKPTYGDKPTTTTTESKEAEKTDAPVCIFPYPGAPGC